MNDKKKILQELRREIDGIDTIIHDLLIRRTGVVERVRDLKKDEAVKIRPAREAEILYRLVDRHHGHFPKRELTRVWREIIVATLGFEGPFSAAYLECGDGCGMGDMTRDQYGSFTPMTELTSARRLIDTVRAQDSIVGILPLPRPDDEDPWWRHLASGERGVPRVIARLPFISGSNQRGGELEALVICPVDQEPTGRDRSFIVIETDGEIGPAALRRALAAAAMPPLFTAPWHFSAENGPRLYLLEVDGFVDVGGGCLRRLNDILNEKPGATPRRVIALGGYAVPLTLADLGPRKGDGR
jgi:chorismate mutase